MLMGDSEDEQERERDEYERQRERDEEHYSERSGDGGRAREPLSRRVTGAESHRHPKPLKRTQEEGHEAPSGATPPKRPQLVPVRHHTDLVGDARPTRYRGTEPYDPRRGGHTSTSERRAHKDTRASHERRRLFNDDVLEQEGFIDHFMEAAEATSQPDLDGIIAAMGMEQLVANLQHMAFQRRTLQCDTTAPGPSGRYPRDNPTKQTTPDPHTADVTTSTPEPDAIGLGNAPTAHHLP